MLRNIKKFVAKEFTVGEVTAMTSWAKREQLAQNAFQNDTEMLFKWQLDAFECSRFWHSKVHPNAFTNGKKKIYQKRCWMHFIFNSIQIIFSKGLRKNFYKKQQKLSDSRMCFDGRFLYLWEAQRKYIEMFCFYFFKNCDNKITVKIYVFYVFSCNLIKVNHFCIVLLQCYILISPFLYTSSFSICICFYWMNWLHYHH